MLYIKHLTINFLIATLAVCSVIIKALASGYKENSSVNVVARQQMLLVLPSITIVLNRCC